MLLEHRFVEPVQPGDHLGQVHDRVDAGVRLAPVRGDAVGDDVDPAEALVLHDQLVSGLRFDHDCRVDAAALAHQVLGAGGLPFLVGDAGDEQVAAQLCARFGDRRQCQHRGSASALVIGGAQAEHPVAVDPGHQRIVRPARVSDGVGVRVQAERRPAARAAQPAQHVRPSGRRLDDLDVGARVLKPLRDVRGDLGLARPGRDQPRGHRLDAHHRAEQLGNLPGGNRHRRRLLAACGALSVHTEYGKHCFRQRAKSSRARGRHQIATIPDAARPPQPEKCGRKFRTA